ncbi:MAG: hypothetical protein OJF49_002163 [Ktedonobacterales bacterium]|nr:MAG: hypothetical protein OJF49_002163 [Ktedonobacterales bacterium]
MPPVLFAPPKPRGIHFASLRMFHYSGRCTRRQCQHAVAATMPRRSDLARYPRGLLSSVTYVLTYHMR